MPVGVVQAFAKRRRVEKIIPIKSIILMNTIIFISLKVKYIVIVAMTVNILM